MKLLLKILSVLILTSCSLFNKGASEQIESVSLSRSGCYGKCPVYQITINRDGSVVYKGDMFVDHIGSYTVDVDVDFQKFENLLESSDFFNLDDQYLENVADIPVCGVTVRTTKKVKSILDNGIAPDELRLFQKEIDRVIKDSEDAVWKKMK